MKINRHYLIFTMLFVVGLNGNCVFANEACAVSPEELVQKFRLSFDARDTENIASLVDFESWVKLIGDSENKIVDPVRLEQQFLDHLMQNEFPASKGLACHYKKTEQIKKLTVVYERCVMQKNGTSVSYTQKTIVVKTDCGWKLSGPYNVNNNY